MGSGEVYEPQLWYSQLLMFTKDQEETRTTSDFLKEIEEERSAEVSIRQATLASLPHANYPVLQEMRRSGNRGRHADALLYSGRRTLSVQSNVRIPPNHSPAPGTHQKEKVTGKPPTNATRKRTPQINQSVDQVLVKAPNEAGRPFRQK